MTDRWMTVEKAVEYLGFPSRASLYMAVRRGQVPAYRMGKRLRFKRSELDRVFVRTASTSFVDEITLV